MQVTETRAEGLTREFSITVPAADIAARIDARLHEVGANVNMPGFRPGKVPMNILRQRYGASVMGEVLEQTVNESSQTAMNDRGLQPAMQPKVEITSFDEGKDLEFSVTVETLPEIEVADLSSIELEKPVVTVDDSEVDTALERVAQGRRTSEKIDEDRPAAKGDLVLIDFLGKIDGTAFDGGKAEDYELELGGGQFIEGFEDQVIGAKAGDDIEVKVAFPEQYPAENLAGKDAVFEVKVKELRSAVMPEIDDEFAKGLGVDDLAALKERIRADISREYDSVSRMRMKRDLLDKLNDAHSFEVPGGMIDQEFETIWERVEEELKSGGMQGEDKDKSEDQLKTEYREISERRVRLGLVLSEIGRTADIQVTQEELNRAMMGEASRYPGREREVMEFYQNNPQAVDALRAPVYEDKVIDYILEMAKQNERSMTAEELMEAEKQAADDGES